MKRLALVAVIVGLMATSAPAEAEHWAQHYHHDRRSGTQTVVYFQNDVAGYQGPYVVHAARVWSKSPRIAVRVVDTCPANRNCVVWRTEDIPAPLWGSTGMTTTSHNHINSPALVRLDPVLGRLGTVLDGKYIVCHEAGHSLGAAIPPDLHKVCSPYTGNPTAHDYAAAALVYRHRDPVGPPGV